MLLVPRAEGIGAAVWVLPVAVLVAAVAGLVLAFRRWRRDTSAPPTDEDRALVERALGAPAPDEAGEASSGWPGNGRAGAERAGRLRGLLAMSAPTADADRLAELEDERRFLLTSLTDLEREHEAGDIDDADYETLKDGYTARGGGRPASHRRGPSGPPAPPATSVGPHRRRRSAHWPSSRSASACWSPTSPASGSQARPCPGGSPRTATAASPRPGRSSAPIRRGRSCSTRRSRRSIPTTSRPRPTSGWLLSIQAANTGSAASITQAEGLLDDAIALDPQRADAYCFKAVVRFRFLQDAATARTTLDQCAALHPPAEVTGLVQGLSEEIDAALAGGAPATTASGAPATTAAARSAADRRALIPEVPPAAVVSGQGGPGCYGHAPCLICRRIPICRPRRPNRSPHRHRWRSLRRRCRPLHLRRR